MERKANKKVRRRGLTIVYLEILSAKISYFGNSVL